LSLSFARWEDNYGVYGGRKIQAALRRDKHVVIGRDQTARMMRELGLTGVRRRKPKRTTIADEPATRPADLVERRFTADRPDQLWLVDLTYIRTWVGFAYLALIVDVFAREPPAPARRDQTHPAGREGSHLLRSTTGRTVEQLEYALFEYLDWCHSPRSVPNKSSLYRSQGGSPRHVGAGPGRASCPASHR
jgi:transposase InsO family protein